MENSGRPSQPTRGNAHDLLRLLKKSRDRGQTRSVLAGGFFPSDVRVQAHTRSVPAPSISQEEQEGPVAWRGITLRYSRLVQPTPVSPVALGQYAQRLRSMAGHPQFARLNHNKQLGTTCWAGGLGASHSRLEHSLGVLDIALMLVEQLGRYMEKISLDGKHVLAIQRVVLLLAFIHDAFHGPYGHTMDPIRSIIAPACKRSRLDKEALAHFIERAARRRSGWLFDALQVLYGDKNPDLNLDLELLFSMYIKGDPSLAYAREIVESAMDCDRLDYIPRDHAHIFLNNKLAATSEIVRDALFRDDKAGTPHLHFAISNLEEIEAYLAQRLFLYDNVYESREKIPYDEMLIHAVLYLFDDHGCGSQALPFHDDFDKRMEIFEEFTQLSDSDLERVFDILQPTPKRVIAQLLVEDVRVNAPFQVVDLRPIPAVGLAAMLYRYQSLSELLSKAFAELPGSVRAAYKWGAPADAWTLRREAAKRVMSQANIGVKIQVDDQELFSVLSDFGEGEWNFRDGSGSVTVGTPPNEEIYWMCMQLGDHISAKRTFEVFLWRELQRHWSGYATWRAELKKEILSRCGQLWHNGGIDEFMRHLDQVIDSTPLVFVSCTRITGRLDDVILRNRGEEDPVRLWTESDESCTVRIASSRGGRSSYYSMLVASTTFGKEALTVLKKVWEDSIEALAWWAAPDAS